MYYYFHFGRQCYIFYCAVYIKDDGLQPDDDETEDTGNIDTLEDFATKTCLDPLMNKESFEQEIEGMVGLEDPKMEGSVGLEDQEMEHVTQSTDQADQNLVLLVVGENRRKRARTVGEGNSMDNKVVDRVKRKNPEDDPGNLHMPTVHCFS
jgi:hypothetical protein